MWTQHSKIKMVVGSPVAEPLERTGPTVRLLAQTQDHNVVFQDDEGEVQTVPSHIFFMTHREATPDEIDAATGPSPTLRTRGGKGGASAEA